MVAVIEIEAVVANTLGARELGDGMCLGLAVTPWRPIGAATTERSVLHIGIDMDLDLADAWMRNIDAGACVRVACGPLPPPGSIGRYVDIRGENLDVQRRPHGWPRAPDGRLSIGDRTRLTSGDLIGETAVVRALASGPSRLYTLVLDSDGTVIQTVADRIVILT